MQTFFRSFMPKITDSEVVEIMNAHKKKKDLNSTDLSISSNEIRMDVSLLDSQFDKFLLDQESLNGVLNSKVTKQKNAEFRLKIEAWKKRVIKRKKTKLRTIELYQAIQKDFQKFITEFENEKQNVFDCNSRFHDLYDSLV